MYILTKFGAPILKLYAMNLDEQIQIFYDENSNITLQTESNKYKELITHLQNTILADKDRKDSSKIQEYLNQQLVEINNLKPLSLFNIYVLIQLYDNSIGLDSLEVIYQNTKSLISDQKLSVEFKQKELQNMNKTIKQYVEEINKPKIVELKQIDWLTDMQGNAKEFKNWKEQKLSWFVCDQAEFKNWINKNQFNIYNFHNNQTHNLKDDIQKYGIEKILHVSISVSENVIYNCFIIKYKGFFGLMYNQDSDICYGTCEQLQKEKQGIEYKEKKYLHANALLLLLIDSDNIQELFSS